MRAACSQSKLKHGYPLMVPTTSTLIGACELSRLFDFDSLESVFEQIGSVQSSQFAAFDFDAATRNISIAMKLSLHMMEHNLQDQPHMSHMSPLQPTMHRKCRGGPSSNWISHIPSHPMLRPGRAFTPMRGRSQLPYTTTIELEGDRHTVENC